MDTLGKILRRIRLSVLGEARFAGITREHFEPLDDPERQKRLFARSVRLVEVEVHSFCNRTCWFCPNSFIDRRSERRYLDEAVWLRLLADLEGIRYRGIFTFSRYCEPFADEIFYTRLAEASEHLPEACLHTNTNGDYLNDETLARAAKAGLRRLYLQLYLAEEDEFTPEVVGELAERMKKRVPSVRFRAARATRDWIGYAGRHGRMEILMYARDFRAGGVNRCGLRLTERYRRISPCFRPFTDLYIDYDGSVMPCCNLRSDHPDHAASVWGKLDATPGAVFRVFSGAAAANWRRRLVNFSPKDFPCDDCRFDVTADTRVNRMRAKRAAGKSPA